MVGKTSWHGENVLSEEHRKNNSFLNSGGKDMREDYWDIGIDFRKFMPEMYKGELYHYTSANALFNILEKDNTFLWASRQDCLNDISEGMVANELYQSVLDELYDSKKISCEYYKDMCKDKLEFDKKAPASYQQKGTNKRIETYNECELFVCCFSTEKDSLPMWNYYSKWNHYEGYNLGFSVEKLLEELNNLKNNTESSWSNVEFDIFPVVYSEKEQREYIRNLLLRFYKSYIEDKMDLDIYSTFVVDALNEWNAIFKKDCFSHEKEVRLIIRRPIKTNSDMACEKLPQLHYRHKNEYIIPYIKTQFPNDVLESVCFGPMPLNETDRKIQAEILRNALLNRGYNVPTIAHSQIPVRY